MATFTAIPEKTQSAKAMKRVLDYVMQEKKTLLDGVQLVSGQNCVPESAYQEFMATKHRFGKATGVFFKQYVQSFMPDCGVTPGQIHQIGLETAKAFDGFEVVVATHIDRDHWHNHFVVNSVNCETGLKIQINEKGLEQLRERSDEICQQFGLETLKPYKKPKQRTINQREYRAALRGDSKKLQLANAIDYAVAVSRTKQQFIEEMQKRGYDVKWIDHYKYITYTTPDGQRFRDNRLPDNKYLKSNMEELFAYGYEQAETNESIRADNERNGISLDGADTADIPYAQAGAVQSTGGVHLDDWRRHCQKHGFDVGAAYSPGSEQSGDENTQTVSVGYAERGESQDGLDRAFRNGQVVYADGIFEKATPATDQYDDDGDEGEGYNTLEDEAEVDADWRDIAVDSLYLAADLAMIAGGDDRKKSEKKRAVRERKRGQKKEHDEGFDMSM